MQFILSPLFTIQMQVHIFAVIPFTSKWPFSAAFDKAVCRYHPLFSSLFAPEDKSFSTTLRMGDLKTWKRYESKVFTTHLEKHQDLDPFLNPNFQHLTFSLSAFPSLQMTTCCSRSQGGLSKLVDTVYPSTHHQSQLHLEARPR